MRNLFFLLVLVLHLVCILIRWDLGVHFTKPFLLPVLLLFYVNACKMSSLPLNGIVIGALFFSFLGDVLLIFQSQQSVFFILGLVAFLIAHVFYIFYFVKIQKRVQGLAWNLPATIIILIYAMALFAILYPNLGVLKIPVLVYALVISTMLFFVVHSFGKIKASAAIVCLIGAILFVLSDSILAFNKFHTAFEAASFLIMLTYGLAQFFLVKGILEVEASKRTK